MCNLCISKNTAKIGRAFKVGFFDDLRLGQIGCQQKKFELVDEFELTNTITSKFGFKIANKTVAYHIKSQVLHDVKLVSDVVNDVKTHFSPIGSA